MDEADILGDRICIMCDGKATWCGTPLFLKTKFGIGYNLSFSRNNIEKSEIIFEKIC